MRVQVPPTAPKYKDLQFTVGPFCYCYLGLVFDIVACQNIGYTNTVMNVIQKITLFKYNIGMKTVLDTKEIMSIRFECSENQRIETLVFAIGFST